MKYINLCPHPITIRNDAMEFIIPMGTEYLNLNEKWELVDIEIINGYSTPIYNKTTNACTLLDYMGNIIEENWKPEFNKKYIVSAYLKNTLFPDTENVYSPGRNIKANKKIVACLGLTNSVITEGANI